MEINETLDEKGLAEAPHGTAVRYRSNEYVKTHEFWTRTNYFLVPLNITEGTVIALPEGDDLGEEDDLQYEQRIIAFTRGMAHAHGVWTQRVNEVFDGLGVTVAIAPGAWLHVYDRDTLARVPAGTLVQQGSIDHWPSYSVWRRRHQSDDVTGYWERVTGGSNVNNHGLGWVQIVGGDIDGEWDDSGSVFTDRLAFRRTLWEAGRQAKVDERWCPSFERVMLAIGIDGDTIRAERLDTGSSVDTELTEGTRIRRIPGVPHRYEGVDYGDNEASDGAVGTLDILNGDGTAHVTWLNGTGGSNIDLDCIEEYPEGVVSHGFEVGQTIPASDLIRLPIGAVAEGVMSHLHYRRIEGDAMRITETGASGRCSEYAGRFVIEALPLEPLQRLASTDQLAEAPDGTCIAVLHGGYWRKEDGSWTGTLSRTRADEQWLNSAVTSGNVVVSPPFEGNGPNEADVQHVSAALLRRAA